MDKVESKLSRRNLLVVMGGAVAVAGAFAAAPVRNVVARTARDLASGVPGLRGLVSLANGSFEEWQAQVGSHFALGGGSAIQLSGVRALASSGSRPIGVSRQRAFVAFFEPLGGGSLAPDLIYTANHPQYGPLQIFLSAAPGPRAPARMLAVFN